MSKPRVSAEKQLRRLRRKQWQADHDHISRVVQAMSWTQMVDLACLLYHVERLLNFYIESLLNQFRDISVQIVATLT